MNKEIQFVKNLISQYPKSQLQLNTPYSSDAEVICANDEYICISTDTIAEEISLGLIRDFKSLGWLTVTASVSDLAAIGVITQQVLINFGRGPEVTQKNDLDFYLGVSEACAHFGCELNKIETFSCQQTISTGTAMALVKEKPLLNRQNLRPGDHLFLTGPLGLGNAVAFANLALKSKVPDLVNQLDANYRPQARVRESQLIRRFSNCCIDTSDGGLFSFDLLQQLNATGLEISYDKNIFHPQALEIAQMSHVNPWLFFAAQNGEFELLFSVSENRLNDFYNESRQSKMNFVSAGRVEKGQGLRLKTKDQTLLLNLKPIENLLQEMVDPSQYILALQKFAESNHIEV